jgi:hypothetical protein
MKIPLKENYCGIYAITNNKSKKVYIGSSVSVYYRTRRHLCDLRKNRHKNSHLQNSFNKHGEKCFSIVKIDVCKEDRLLYLEKYYIDVLKPKYNIQLNPIRQIKTPEMRVKISNSLKNGYRNGTIKPTKQSKVSVYNSDGSFLVEFNSIKECIETLKLSKTRVHQVLNKKQAHTKGYQIFYSNKEHNPKKLNLTIGNSGYLETDIMERYQKPD